MIDDYTNSIPGKVNRRGLDADRFGNARALT